jgi:hypothetical protein
LTEERQRATTLLANAVLTLYAAKLVAYKGEFPKPLLEEAKIEAIEVLNWAAALIDAVKGSK